MKNTIALLLFLTLGLGTLSAQKTLEHGTITMKVEMDGPMAGMMKESTVTTHFSGKKLCFQMQLMGGAVNMTVVSMGEGAGLVLFDAPMLGKRLAMETTKEDQMPEPKEGDAAVYTYLKKTTKKILDYECHKVLMTRPGSTDTTEIWVTNRIKVQNDLKKQFKGLEGFPMEYEVLADRGMKLKFLAVEVSKDAPDEQRFSLLVPEGFGKVSKKDFEKEVGGMGGFGM